MVEADPKHEEAGRKDWAQEVDEDEDGGQQTIGQEAVVEEEVIAPATVPTVVKKYSPPV